MKSASRHKVFSSGGCPCLKGKNGTASCSFAHFGVITPHAEPLNSAAKGEGPGSIGHLIQSTDFCAPMLKLKIPLGC